MVVGENHKELMDKYSVDLEVEPYVRYEYLKASTYLNTSLKTLSKMLENSDFIGIADMGGNLKNKIRERIKALQNISAFEYYKELTNGMYYDKDGNALSTENPNGHWKTARIGKNFSLPLILYNGEKVYTAKACDINWKAMETPKEMYIAAWETVMEGREPNGDAEKVVYNSMKDKTSYFSNFKTKEDYVQYSTSYWNYAYVDKNGWFDIENVCKGDEKEWISTFFDRFVKKINPNDTITIYECTINNI